MREIKFRAWDGRAMITPYSVRGGKATIIKPCSNDDNVLMDKYGVSYYCNWDIDQITDYPLMQFTGLTDQNGVEIYEGDIVRIRNKFVTSVTFFEGCFYTVTDGGNYRCGGWERYAIEVIGNIYQNPELLEVPA